MKCEMTCKNKALLVALVVILVLIILYTGLRQEVINEEILVVSPIEDLASSIQEGELVSKVTALREGEVLRAELVEEKLEDTRTIQFKCGDTVCQDTEALKVYSDRIEAKMDAQFKCLIECEGSGCILTVLNG